MTTRRDPQKRQDSAELKAEPFDIGRLFNQAIDSVGHLQNDMVEKVTNVRVRKQYVASISPALASQYVQGKAIVEARVNAGKSATDFSDLKPAERKAAETYKRLHSDLPSQIPFYNKDVLARDLERDIVRKAQDSAAISKPRVTLSEARVESRDAKAAIKPEVKSDARPALSKSEIVSDKRSDRGELKVDARTNSKSENRAETRSENKSANATAGRIENKLESRPEGKAETRADARSLKTTNEPGNALLSSLGRRGQETIHVDIKEAERSRTVDRKSAKQELNAAAEAPKRAESSTARLPDHSSASIRKSNDQVAAKLPEQHQPREARSSRAEALQTKQQEIKESGEKSNFERKKMPESSLMTSSLASQAGTAYMISPARLINARESAVINVLQADGLRLARRPDVRADLSIKFDLSVLHTLPHSNRPALPSPGIVTAQGPATARGSGEVPKISVNTSTVQPVWEPLKAPANKPGGATVEPGNQPENSAKSGKRPESKPTSTTEFKTENKSERKIENKPGSKTESKTEGKTESKTQFKTDNKTDNQIKNNAASGPTPENARPSLKSDNKISIADDASEWADRKYISGPEIALAAIIALAGTSRLRSENQLLQFEGMAIVQTFDENLTEMREKKPLRTTAPTTATPMLRPKILVNANDSLISIAEQLFNDSQLCWLILDVNKNLTTAEIEGKTIVRLRTRQEIAIPVYQDIVDFRQNEQVRRTENLVTIVEETQLDREMLESGMAPVLGHQSKNKDPLEQLLIVSEDDTI